MHGADDPTVVICGRCRERLPSTGGQCPCIDTASAPEPELPLHTARAADAGLAPPPTDRNEGAAVRAALEPDYDVLEEIGRGGMAIVYRAVERSLDREVAIKVLPLSRTFDKELVERFQREARTAAGLEHPHVIPIYRVGESGPVSYFVMKFIQGPSLADMLDDGEPLPTPKIHQMIIEVAEALDFAHRHGVVHRDIKPDNIMMDGTGRFVVADFGIAKSLEASSLTQADSSIGTPKYMSPEQGTGRPVDGRSDMYSLGIVAYHCLTGRPPFEGTDPLAVLHAHVNTPVAAPPDLQGPVERNLFSVIQIMTEKNPDDRAQDGAALRLLLEADRQLPVRVRGRSDSGWAVAALVVGWLRSRSRRSWLGGAAAVTLLVVLFGWNGAEKRCRQAIRAEDSGLAVLVDDFGPLTAGDPASVDFLVCGLADDAMFSAEVEIAAVRSGGVIGGVRRFFSGSGDPNRISWEDRADGIATSRSRPIATGNLSGGDNRVTIRIKTLDGRETEQSQGFKVLEE